MEPAIVKAISGYYKLKQKYDESNNKQKIVKIQVAQFFQIQTAYYALFAEIAHHVR